MKVKTHYFYRKTRASLWSAHRVDRDRTTQRIELGPRVSAALGE